ncbi:hypothetical protein H6F67_01850 [Microcoleus sp. FACHB-1515]|uniref:hypothetical protein n=1 Tax=Cyanophyceae TaxID=3028117 RepID=UPI00168472E1|nr:hypothetical protein [Microcoleus sp. FACHB-1515]MBD2088605.1 hypothetical protein [Microcoleus sp. FACHB-1515]
MLSRQRSRSCRFCLVDLDELWLASLPKIDEPTCLKGLTEFFSRINRVQQLPGGEMMPAQVCL